MRSLEKEVVESPVLFLGPSWDSVSQLGKSLILKMLAKDSGERLTAAQALAHPWFELRHKKVEDSASEPAEPMSPGLDKGTLKQLLEYRGMSKLRMAGINVLVSMLQRKDIDPLRKMF